MEAASWRVPAAMPPPRFSACHSRAISTKRIGRSSRSRRDQRSGAESDFLSRRPERSGSVRSLRSDGPSAFREYRPGAVAGTTRGLDKRAPLAHRGRDGARCLATSHVFLKRPMTEKDLWQIYREAYRDEPFLRIVKETPRVAPSLSRSEAPRRSISRHQIELDEETGRLVVVSAIDNLMKGAAGRAVQCMNLMLGFDETRGLPFRQAHPLRLRNVPIPHPSKLPRVRSVSGHEFIQGALPEEP